VGFCTGKVVQSGTERGFGNDPEVDMETAFEGDRRAGLPLHHDLIGFVKRRETRHDIAAGFA